MFQPTYLNKSFLIFSMACYRQRTVAFLKSYRVRKKFRKQLEVLSWHLIFSSNSGYYYFLAESQV